MTDEQEDGLFYPGSPNPNLPIVIVKPYSNADLAAAFEFEVEEDPDKTLPLDNPGPLANEETKADESGNTLDNVQEEGEL